MDLTTYFSDTDVLMHLGAGVCSELNDYLAAKPNKIVLVEADSELAKSLKKKASKEQSVTVIESLVSTGDDEKAFYRYSLPSTSSTRKGNELFSLYPSLKLVSKVHLPAQDVKQLISNEFDLTSKNALAIDLPGQEFEVLSSLFESELLNNLDKLIVYINSEVLYEGEASLRDTYKLLVEHGFEELFSSIDVLDRKRYVMQRHRLYKQVLGAQALAKNVQQELGKTQTKLAESQKKLKQSEAEHNQALLEKTSEIEALTVKVAEQSDALENAVLESKSAQNELQKTLTSKEAQISELSQTLEQTKAVFASAKSALEQELANAKQTYDGQIAKSKETEAEHNKALLEKTSEIEVLTMKVTEQSDALEQATADSKSAQNELQKTLTSKETEISELSQTLKKRKQSLHLLSLL